MNITITGHHLDVTPAIRGYVEEKMGRVTRHFDQVIDVSVILSVEKLQHKAEANVHVPGRDIYVESIDADMYAALDALSDKLDRQIVKHKEKAGNVHRESGGVKGQTVVEAE
jgi:putative sigma-54 modulation protein